MSLRRFVGQTRCSDAEIFVGKPFFAEHFFNDGVIFHGVVGGGYAAGAFEADAATCLLIIFLDALAHDIGGFERGSGVAFACGSLQEIGSGEK